MFRETPSSFMRAFRPRRNKKKLLLGPHVNCPTCGSNFKTWVGVARHMVGMGPDHHNHIEELTGKLGATFYRPGGLKELAGILKKKLS